MKTNNLLLLIIFAALSSCASSSKSHLSKGLKAEAAPLSSFVDHPQLMKPQRDRAPFALVWVNPSLPTKRAGYDSIYVAPVDTSHLRKARTNISNTAGLEKQRPVAEMANLLRSSFIEAFRQSPSPRLKYSPTLSPKGVTLHLALVELNATDTAGNAIKTAIPYGSAISPLMNGNIAIEGKVRDNATGELLFEFADNERDPMTLVSLRDFKPWDHAKGAIKDWAKQFEELSRTPPTHKVKDSLFFTLKPL